MACMYLYIKNDTKTIIRALFCWHQAILLQLLLIEAIVIVPQNIVPSNFSKSWDQLISDISSNWSTWKSPTVINRYGAPNFVLHKLTCGQKN